LHAVYPTLTAIPTQDAIGQLAARIERAYRRRYPHWNPLGMTPGAWETTAARLLAAVEGDVSIPVDPELFIAAQPRVVDPHNPWTELAQERSLRRYLKVVRRIVGQLREELREEVRRAEKKLDRGVSLDRLLDSSTSKISPLTRYILAHRAGRQDLWTRLRAAAESQHRSCPLYQQAARALLPEASYPTPDESRFETTSPATSLAFSMN